MRKLDIFVGGLMSAIRVTSFEVRWAMSLMMVEDGWVGPLVGAFIHNEVARSVEDRKGRGECRWVDTVEQCRIFWGFVGREQQKYSNHRTVVAKSQLSAKRE